MANAEIIDWEARAIAAEAIVQSVRQYLDWQSQDEYLDKGVQAGTANVVKTVRQIIDGEEPGYG